MSWKHWSSFRNVLLILIHAVLLTIFAHPWLQLAGQQWGFQLGRGSLWFLAAAAGSMVAVAKSVGRGKQGILPVGLISLLLFAFALFWQLPWFMVVPALLLLLLLGVRFADYSGSKSFAADWGWSSFVLLLVQLFGERFTYQLGFPLVFIYFVLGFLAIILWNGIAMEKRGLVVSYRGLSRFIPLFVLGVACLSAALGLLLSPEFLEQVITILGKVYDGVLEVLTFLFVRPFAWLMSPLFRWAERQELTLEQTPIEEYASERPLGEPTPDPSPEVVQAAAAGAWVVFVIILLIVAYFAVRRILRRRHSARESQVTESRESVFSGEEGLGELRRTFQNLVKPLTRLARTRWYQGDDPILLIRTYYARFINRAQRKVPYPPGATPGEYGGEVLYHTEQVDKGALKSLTELYNRARYGEIGDAKDAEDAEEAFSRLRRL